MLVILYTLLHVLVLRQEMLLSMQVVAITFADIVVLLLLSPLCHGLWQQLWTLVYLQLLFFLPRILNDRHRVIVVTSEGGIR